MWVLKKRVGGCYHSQERTSGSSGPVKKIESIEVTHFMCGKSEEFSDSQNVGMPNSVTGLNKPGTIAGDCRIASIITGFAIRITV